MVDLGYFLTRLNNVRYWPIPVVELSTAVTEIGNLQVVAAIRIAKRRCPAALSQCFE